MNLLWSRFIKLTYRRDPLFSFLLTIGAVDAAMGGFSNHGGLAIVGVGTIGCAVAVRWLQYQRRPVPSPEASPQYYLPSRSSQSRLPALTIPPQRSPNPEDR